MKYTEANEMKLNEKKTHFVPFNRANEHVFQPKLTIGQSDQLKMVEQIQLLGSKVRSDMS